jgi:hypothetical protein
MKPLFFASTVAALAASLLAGPAPAKDVDVGGTAITVSPPRGQCELDPNVVTDKSLLTQTTQMTEGSGTPLLAIYVDCQQQLDWRAGKLKYIGKKTLIETLKTDSHEAIPAICADMREQGKKYAADDVERVKRDLADTSRQKQRYDGSLFLGVLDETPETCVAGLVQTFHLGTLPITQLTIFSTVTVRGHTIYFYSASPYVDEQSTKTALPLHKGDVAAFLAQNK